MPRRLLNIASIVCLVLCVALMGMWVRSYHRDEFIRGRISQGRVLAIGSTAGTTGLTEFSPDSINDSDWPWTVISEPINPKILAEWIPEQNQRPNRGPLTYLGFRTYLYLEGI